MTKSFYTLAWEKCQFRGKSLKCRGDTLLAFTLHRWWLIQDQITSNETSALWLDEGGNKPSWQQTNVSKENRDFTRILFSNGRFVPHLMLSELRSQLRTRSVFPTDRRNVMRKTHILNQVKHQALFFPTTATARLCGSTRTAVKTQVAPARWTYN